MRLRLADVALGVAACLAVSAAVCRWPTIAQPASVVASRVIPVTIDPPAIDRDSLEMAMDVIVTSALFGRAKPLTPRPAVAAPAMAGAAALPPLSLKAIVGGPPWQAVVAGVAGESETVVTIGSDVRGLRIQSITRDAVVLRGGDSTWTLTMRPLPR